MIPAANSIVLCPPKDRQVIKDKILNSISKAVKEVQELLLKEEDTLVLTQENKFLHRLCENLDHAFLFGLRHITNGYWRAVKEFTRKETVAQIQSSKHVTTNLGRGRAWLYLALNENCLESYLHCFKDNPKIVYKHYVDCAIMMDQQWLHVLITLMSGLEFVYFRLNVDSDYLDYSMHPYCSANEAAEDEDRISHCSMDSSTSSQVSFLGTSRSLPDGDSSSHTMESSSDSLHLRPHSLSFPEENEVLPHRTVRSLSESLHSKNRSLDLLNNRITRLVNISIVNSCADSEDFNLEVTHIPKTRPVKKKKKNVGNKMNNRDSQMNVNINDSTMETLRTESTSEEDGSPCSCDAIGDSFLEEEPSLRIDEIVNTPHFSPLNSTLEEDSIFRKIPNEESDWNLKIELSLERPGPEGKEAPRSCSGIWDNTSTLEKQESSVYDGFHIHNDDIAIHDELPLSEPHSPDQKEEKNTEIIHSVQRLRRLSSHEMEVDNNTLLLLSLNFFQDQEEQFYKMYRATTGHTEGEVVALFVVLTNRSCYLLHQGSNQHQFTLNNVIQYSELDFISLSLNYQTINLVCINRRRQFWICTGSELLTRSIVSSLEVAIRRNPNMTLPSVLTDATTQKLSLKKWLSKEVSTEASKIEVLHYVLIHWEDSEECPAKLDACGACKEGFLMCRFIQNSLFNGSTWKPGYFSLKNGILFKFFDQDDKEPKFTLHLKGQDCSGCRRSQSNDRPHSFELILSDNSILQLAAANEQEATEWLQAFLQTVSQGNAEVTTDRWLCCCLILTTQKIFMSHEELQTGFIRILGSANISDITKIHIDSEEKSYCIIEFEFMEARVSSGEWIIYFNAAYEQEKFLNVLSKLWSEIFKVSITLSEITDLTLKAQCRLGVRKLHSDWESPDAWLHRVRRSSWI